MIVLRSNKPKARKEHTCDLCFEKINKGEVYNNSTVVYGDIYEWKTHIRCEQIALKLKMYDDEGLTGEIFHECIEDEYIALISFKNTDFKEQLNFVCKYHLYE